MQLTTFSFVILFIFIILSGFLFNVVPAVARAQTYISLLLSSMRVMSGRASARSLWMALKASLMTIGGVAVRLGAGEAVLVGIAVLLGVAVGVLVVVVVGVGVFVGACVAVGVTVLLGVCVLVGVTVLLGVGVAVGVSHQVGVGRGVLVAVGNWVVVGSGVDVAVLLGAAVGVVLVLISPALPPPPQAAITVKAPTAQALKRQEKWRNALEFGRVFMVFPC